MSCERESESTRRLLPGHFRHQAVPHLPHQQPCVHNTTVGQGPAGPEEEEKYLTHLTREIQAEELKLCLWKNTDDGYRWEAYGSRRLGESRSSRKSYYRCLNVRAPRACHAKKVLQEHPEDSERLVVVTYKGRHNHPPLKDVTARHPILKLLHQPEGALVQVPELSPTALPRSAGLSQQKAPAQSPANPSSFLTYTHESSTSTTPSQLAVAGPSPAQSSPRVSVTLHSSTLPDIRRTAPSPRKSAPRVNSFHGLSGIESLLVASGELEPPPPTHADRSRNPALSSTSPFLWPSAMPARHQWPSELQGFLQSGPQMGKRKYDETTEESSEMQK